MKKDHLHQPSLHVLLLCLSLVMISTVGGCRKVGPPAAPEMPGITPGKSTERDVVHALGEPEKKRTVGAYMLYYYPAPVAGMSRPHEVYFKDSIVCLIIITTVEDNLELVLERYGIPEKVTWSSSSFLWTRLFVYASRGFAVTANNILPPASSQVLERWYFEPTSAEQFVKEWRGIAIPSGPRDHHDTKAEDFWNRGP